MKKQNLKNKKQIMKGSRGITLVALIITIIVLLILAVVAISAVNNTGIIQYAQNSADEYKGGRDKENSTLVNYVDILNHYKLNGGTSNPLPEDDEILWTYTDEGDGYTFLNFRGNVKELILDGDKEVKAFVEVYNQDTKEFEYDENSEVITKKFSDVYSIYIEEGASVENLTLGKIASGEKFDAFQDSIIKNLIILGNCEITKTHFFENTQALETVVINEGAKTIGRKSDVGLGYSAFSYCPELKSIVIPSTVTFIDHEWGDGCTSLTSVRINKTADEIKAMENYPWSVSGKIYDKDNNLVQ